MFIRSDNFLRPTISLFVHEEFQNIHEMKVKPQKYPGC